MPCHDAEPTYNQKRLAIIVACHEELDTGTIMYHGDKRLINWPQGRRDKETARLCHRLGQMPAEEIRDYSLELQIWWRDHQVEDDQ